MTHLSPEHRSSSDSVVAEFEVALGFENSSDLNPFYPDWVKGQQGRLGLRLEDLQALLQNPNNPGAAVLWFSVELPEKMVDLKIVEAPPTEICYLDRCIVLDLDKKDLIINSESQVITNQTYMLLELFMANPGMVFSKSSIIRNVVEPDKRDLVRTTSVWKMVRLARTALGEFSSFIQTTNINRDSHCSYFFDVNPPELSTA